MHGLQPMVPPPLHRNSFHSRLPKTGHVQLPNMLHPGPTCSSHKRGGVLGYGANTFDSLFWRIPLLAVFLHRTPLSCSDELFRPRNCIRGGRQVPAVQLQWNSTLSRRTSGLPSPSPGVGRLCARDHTRRELFPERVHRLCYHKARSLARMWW